MSGYLIELSRYTILLNRMKALREESLDVYNVSEWDDPQMGMEIQERLEWIDELVMKLSDGFKKVVMSYQT